MYQQICLILYVRTRHPLGEMSRSSNSMPYVLLSGSKLVLPFKADGKT